MRMKGGRLGLPSRQGRTAIPQRRRRGEARCSLPKGTNGHQPSDQENQIRAKVSIDCCLAISKTSNGPETGSTEDCVLGTQFESFRLHHAFRLSKRFPGCPVTSAQLAELWRELRLCRRVPVNFSGCFVAFVSAHKIPFPGNRDAGSKRRGSNSGQLLSKDQ